MAMELHLLLSVSFFVFISLHIPWSTSSYPDQGGHVCISQGGRFPRFSFEGQSPRKSSKGPDDLTLCRVYRKKTCCTAAQTHPALVSIRKLASNGEGNQECLGFWEAMECAICDPRVGVNPGPPVLCISFCDSSLKACGDAFFSFDSVTQVLMPCGPRDTICARGREWASNGSEFCQLAGFAVSGSNGIEITSCFDGKASLDTSGTGSQEPIKKGSHDKPRSVLQRVRKLLKQMDVGEAVLWAVGGLVLTAGVILLRRRSLSSQRKKAALLRAVQEARLKQQVAVHMTSKKSGKRG